MTLTRIISGGQTGVDQAALRAAKSLNIETGGWVPRGCRTLAGEWRGLVKIYGCREHDSPAYPPRTEANVRWADGTLILTNEAASLDYENLSPGTKLTLGICRRKGKRWCLISNVMGDEPSMPPNNPLLVEFVANCSILNVAGPAEEHAPGIGAAAERYLRELFEAVANCGVESRPFGLSSGDR